MTLPPFPDIRACSDYELGGLLLGYFSAFQADRLGIPPDHLRELDEESSKQFLQYIEGLECDTAADAALEKAMRKAVSGDFETAGRLLREHMLNGAVAMKFIPIGIKKSAQAKKFGREGAKGNKEEGEANRENVLKAANAILAGRTRKPSDRELAKLIATKISMPFNTVRGHLTKLRKDNKLD